MKKYMIRYLILWLPAVLVSYFYNNSTAVSQGLQWIFAVLMVVGWSVNTGMLAYRFPKFALSLLLLYTGASVLLITMLYAAHYNTTSYMLLSKWGGILSFIPLDIMVRAILDFSIPHEIYITGLLVACCLIGYLIGLFYRKTNPDPYRPRIIR